jgi:hypothetical protein
MSKKLKAYLIDPKAQTVTEVKVGKGLPALYDILKCKHITASGKALRGNYSDGFDSILVIDEPIEDLDPEDTKYWFQVDADRNPPSSFPICGRGLVQGADKFGETCDVTISIAEVRSRITFTRRRFQGFEVTHGSGEMFGKRIDDERQSGCSNRRWCDREGGGEMSNTYVFTPRLSDGVRLHLRLNHTTTPKSNARWSGRQLSLTKRAASHFASAAHREAWRENHKSRRRLYRWHRAVPHG